MASALEVERWTFIFNSINPERGTLNPELEIERSNRNENKSLISTGPYRSAGNQPGNCKLGKIAKDENDHPDSEGVYRAG